MVTEKEKQPKIEDIAIPENVKKAIKNLALDPAELKNIDNQLATTENDLSLEAIIDKFTPQLTKLGIQLREEQEIQADPTKSNPTGKTSQKRR